MTKRGDKHSSLLLQGYGVAPTRRPPPKTILALLVLPLLLIAAIGVWQFEASRTSLRSVVLRDERNLAVMAASSVSNILNEQELSLSSIAVSPDLLTPVLSHHWSAVESRLALLLSRYRGFASMAIYSALGKLDVRYPPDPKMDRDDLILHSDVADTLQRGGAHVSNSYLSTDLPIEEVVSISVPMYSTAADVITHEHPLSSPMALEATIPVSAITKLANARMGSGMGYLLLFDSRGVAMNGPAAGSSPPEHSKLLRAVLAGKTGSGVLPVPGFSGDKLIAYAPVPKTGWGIVVERPMSFLNGPLADLEGRLGVITAIVLLAVLAVAWIIARLLAAVISEKNRATVLLSSIGDGVYVLDPLGRVTSINPAMESLSGRDLKSVMNKPWWDAFCFYDGHGQRVAYEESVVYRAHITRKAVSSQGLTRVLERPDGSRLPVSLTAAPVLNERGRLAGVVAIVRDISKDKEVDELKSQLISTVSHELRTPLTMIHGFAELLLFRKDLGSKQSEEALEQIYSASDRLSRLVDDLLSASKIDAGKMILTPTEVDLARAVRDAEGAIPFDQRSRIVTRLGAEPIRVYADSDKLVQIIVNLLSNALKYSSADSEVEVSTTTDGEFAEISVVDHGIGMSDEEMSKVFEKFGRVNRQEVRRVGGTGLGLYITKSLVELHGGKIRVSSSPGKGSVFSFTVPLVLDEPGKTIDERIGGDVQASSFDYDAQSSQSKDVLRTEQGGNPV